MKRNVTSLEAAICLTIVSLLYGCGGGGGSDSNDTAGGSNSPQDLAPTSASGRSVRLMEAASPSQDVYFASSGDAYSEYAVGTTNLTANGTYLYEAQGNTATLRLTRNTGAATTYTLNFTSQTSGTFTFVSSANTAGSGTFSNFVTSSGVPNPNPNPDPNPNPGPGGDDATGGLDGKVMSLMRSTGQTHTYTFTGKQFVDEDPPERGYGFYSYTRTGSTGRLMLEYTGPATEPYPFAGDKHEVILDFQTDKTGSYSGTYFRNDGATAPQTGTFSFD